MFNDIASIVLDGPPGLRAPPVSQDLNVEEAGGRNPSIELNLHHIVAGVHIPIRNTQLAPEGTVADNFLQFSLNSDSSQGRNSYLLSTVIPL